MSDQPITFRDKCVLTEYLCSLCNSENGFVGGGICLSLSGVTCNLKLDPKYSDLEVIARVFKVVDSYMLYYLKELARNFDLNGVL